MRAVAIVLAVVSAAASPPPLYKDAAAPIPARVRDLISRMTAAEKAAQLWTREVDRNVAADCAATGLGATNVANAHGATPAARLASRNAIQSACLTNRLGIPLSFFQEGLHSGGLGGVIFPAPPTTACAWNVTLATAIGAALANEARACGVDNVWSPVLNMWSDDRFGRFQEGFSPDPVITAHLGRAVVLGLQGGASAQDDMLPGGANESVWSTAKHFAGWCRVYL